MIRKHDSAEYMKTGRIYAMRGIRLVKNLRVNAVNI